MRSLVVRPFLVVLLSLALLATACTGDDDDSDTGDAPSTTSTETGGAETPTAGEDETAEPTDAAEPTADAESPTEAATGEPTDVPAATETATTATCTDVPLPEEAADLTSVMVDLTGDGVEDELATYAVPSENNWRVRITYGSGGVFEETIAGSDFVGAARPIGGQDIDGDGRPEAFVTVGSGASTILVGLYVVGDCSATRVTNGDVPARFPVGATVANSSGLRCTATGIDRLFASSVDGEQFTGGFEPFTLEGTNLEPGEPQVGEFTGVESAGAFARFVCGDLALPE